MFTYAWVLHQLQEHSFLLSIQQSFIVNLSGLAFRLNITRCLQINNIGKFFRPNPDAYAGLHLKYISLSYFILPG